MPKPRYTLPLLALTSSCLISCADTGSSRYCPAPVWPDKCAWKYYMSLKEKPACFQSFMDKVVREQEAIEEACP